MSRRRLVQVTGVVLILMLVAAACGSGGSGQGGGKKGGNIIVAAEQFPDCLNIVDTCSASSWFHWVAAQLVIPKATTLDKDGNFIASPLITQMPTLENGGLKENPFTVTYNINPDAVWEDGSPITWADFEFTWQAILKTKGTYSTLGYDKIQSVKRGKDDREVIVTYKEPYADWWDVFGGSGTSGYVLKKAAFPGGPDVAGKMQTEIPFSGGPWRLQSFTKDSQIIMVRNDRYWGKKAIADQLTVIAREEQATEIQALRTGEAFVAYPQPADPGFTKEFTGNLKFETGLGTTYEGLWINMDKAPMNDPKVRQAFAYAADRQSVVDTVVKPDVPDASVLNCAGWVPNVGDWCDNSDYEMYKYDPQRARQLLQEAGRTCPASGTCTKGGRPLTVQITTTAGNTGRRLSIEILQNKAKAAGFDIRSNFLRSPSPIFTDFLPKRQHTVAIFANVASPDPSVSSFLHSGQIPDASGSGGSNWSGWKNPRVDALLDQADKELNQQERRDALRQVGDLEAQELPWIPMYQKPLIVVWRDDKIGGPVTDFVSSPLSVFYNINEWFLK